MRKGHKPVPDETLAEPHGVQYYKKRIRNNMILFVEGSCLFLFFYEGRYYVTNPEKDESVFQFKKNLEQPFVETREFADSRNFHEALWEKYYTRLENGNWMDPEEYFACFEGSEESFQAISKKQRVFLDVVRAIGRGEFSGMRSDGELHPLVGD